MSRVRLLGVGALAAGAFVAAGGPSARETPTGAASGGGLESVTLCRPVQRVVPERVRTAGEPGRGAAGVRLAAREHTRDHHGDLVRFGGVKSPAIVRAGHTVTVSVDRRARSFARLSHGSVRAGQLRPPSISSHDPVRGVQQEPLPEHGGRSAGHVLVRVLPAQEGARLPPADHHGGPAGSAPPEPAGGRRRVRGAPRCSCRGSWGSHAAKRWRGCARPGCGRRSTRERSATSRGAPVWDGG